MDLDILKLLETKELYNRYNHLLNKGSIIESTWKVVNDMKEYYESHDTIDWETFSTWFRTIKHRTMKAESLDNYNVMFQRLKELETFDPDKLIVLAIKEREHATKISDIAMAISEGDTDLTLKDIEEAIEVYHRDIDRAKEIHEMFVTDDIDEIMGHVVGGSGLDWRLKELNLSCGPIRQGDFLIIGARPDTGKCLAKGTSILMYDGTTKPVEKVLENDLVMGPDSTPRVATGLTKGSEPMYRIQYKNGDYYDVNESHVLSLKRSKTEGKHKHGDIVNVSVAEYLTWAEGRKERYKGWKTGVNFTHDYDDSMLHYFSPYLLGAWLGDGHSDSFTLSNADEEVWQAVLEAVMEENKFIWEEQVRETMWDNPYDMEYATTLKYLDYNDTYKVQYQATNNTGQAITCRVTHGLKGVPNVFKRRLRALNLLGNKHIPHIYKVASYEFRLDLLAGLIDTDGSKSGTGYEITQKNKTLAEDILFVARSLGYSASMNEKVINGTSYWRIHMYGDFSDLPVRIHYKKQEVPENPKRKGLQYGFDVIPLGEGEYYGFAVDKDHLFMLGDFTVTHNTTLLAAEATYMATQLEEDKDVLWFNNEEEGRKVKSRIWQAALEKEVSWINTNREEAKEQYENLLGRIDRIKVIDNKRMHVRDIEAVLRDTNAGLIIFDQLWKVSGFEKEATTETDRYTKLFAWAREIASAYAPVITVHQADASAHGVEYIEMNALYMSKTGMQGEADAIITLGRDLSGSGSSNMRGLYVPKNKLAGGGIADEAYRNGKFEIEIQPTVARFKGAY